MHKSVGEILPLGNQKNVAMNPIKAFFGKEMAWSQYFEEIKAKFSNFKSQLIRIYHNSLKII